jgi:hypothetical protein
MIKMYQSLVGNPEEKIWNGGASRTWEDNINVQNMSHSFGYLQTLLLSSLWRREIRHGGGVWVQLTYDKVQLQNPVNKATILEVK